MGQLQTHAAQQALHRKKPLDPRLQTLVEKKTATVLTPPVTSGMGVTASAIRSRSSGDLDCGIAIDADQRAPNSGYPAPRGLLCRALRGDEISSGEIT